MTKSRCIRRYYMSNLILPYTEDTSAAVVTPHTASPSSRPANGSTSHAKTLKTPRPNPNEVTSLSYDQVNDDAGELVELRGEGRYFGVTDPSLGETINAAHALGPLCGNCHQRGHPRHKCKTVVCHKCGVVGEHYEQHCPKTLVCSRCNLKGHTVHLCPQKEWKRQYCKLCDSFNHSDERCPSIWRLYLTRAPVVTATLPTCIACYNCGSSKHYGDECKEARVSRFPNHGTAFSGLNLPRELRDEYFTMVLRAARTSRSDNYRGSHNIKNGFGNNHSNKNSSHHLNLNLNLNQNYNLARDFSSSSSQNSSGRRSESYPQRANFNSKPPPRKPTAALGSHSIGSRALPSGPGHGRVAKPTRLGFIESRNSRGPPKQNFNSVSKMY